MGWTQERLEAVQVPLAFCGRGHIADARLRATFRGSAEVSPFPV